MYGHVFVAGTFDGLHKGHRELLVRAFAEGEKVTIGLTSDVFVKKFKIQNSCLPAGTAKFKIRTQDERKIKLQDWLHKQGYDEKIISIDDPYEPAASMPDIDAIVVTNENKKRGEEINEKRKNRGLLPLALVEVPVVAAEDGSSISSTRMRNGEISADGKLILPDSLRPELRKPIGRVLTGDAIASSMKKHQPGVVITVGDATTETALDLGIIPHLAIVDLHIARKLHDTLAKVPEILLYYSAAVESGPGFISAAAQRAIAAWATHCRPTLLIVKGEEDLLALPAIVSAPVGAVVYYGQPGEGIIEVPVAEEKKSEARSLLAQFTTVPFAVNPEAT